MKIDFANLKFSYLEHKEKIDEAIASTISSTSFIMGQSVYEFEDALAKFSGAKYAISCSSGTDALLLAMMALGIKPGDEVITTPFTFIATAETIAFLGAKPVFVDINEQTYNIDVSRIEEKITKNTKAILPVSLYGQISDMEAINKIALKYSLPVIEDGAQSFGATYKGKRSCNVSAIGTTSFFPAKPLGCFGDGGALFTSDEYLADKMKSMRIHGQTKRYHHKYIGMGGRMDTIQAAVLLSKLPSYPEEITLRQTVAENYNQKLQTTVTTPDVSYDRTSVWAQYTVRLQNRDAIQGKLKEQGIPTAVHYPMPLHLQECFQTLGYQQGDFPVAELLAKEVMSLPMNPFLTKEEIDIISIQLDKNIDELII